MNGSNIPRQFGRGVLVAGAYSNHEIVELIWRGHQRLHVPISRFRISFCPGLCFQRGMPIDIVATTVDARNSDNPI